MTVLLLFFATTTLAARLLSLDNVTFCCEDNATPYCTLPYENSMYNVSLSNSQLSLNEISSSWMFSGYYNETSLPGYCFAYGSDCLLGASVAYEFTIDPAQGTVCYSYDNSTPDCQNVPNAFQFNVTFPGSTPLTVAVKPYNPHPELVIIDVVHGCLEFAGFLQWKFDQLTLDVAFNYGSIVGKFNFCVHTALKSGMCHK